MRNSRALMGDTDRSTGEGQIYSWGSAAGNSKIRMGQVGSQGMAVGSRAEGHMGSLGQHPGEV